MKYLAMILSVAISVSLLNGCGVAHVPSPENDDIETALPAIEAATEESIPAGSAAYSIDQVDCSYIDEATNEPLIRLTYDRVVITGSVGGAAEINRQVMEGFEDYKARREEIGTYLDTPFLTVESPVFYTVSAEVTHNSGNIFCIKYGEDWFMGGVHNFDLSAETYDLETGKKLTLADIIPEQEAQLRQYVLEWVNETYGEGVLGDPAEVLAGFAFDAIPFCLRDGQIILTFPTYTFAPGAAGATVIETEIYIGN